MQWLLVMDGRHPFAKIRSVEKVGTFVQHLYFVACFIDFLSSSTRSSNKGFVDVIHVESKLFDFIEQSIHFGLQILKS